MRAAHMVKTPRVVLTMSVICLYGDLQQPPELIPQMIEKWKERYDMVLTIAPDLVVEVISESSRRLDKKTKKALYERFDVIEYWLADPELGIVEIYRRDEANKLVKAAEYEDTGKITSPLLPGLAIDLETLL